MRLPREGIRRSSGGLGTFAEKISWYSRSAFGSFWCGEGILGRDLSLESSRPFGGGLVEVLEVGDWDLDEGTWDHVDDREDVGDKEAGGEGGVRALLDL
jgi:hypothetical protein